METSGHHLIMGELEDIISGKRLPDTHDERYRQKLAGFLLHEKGFSREDIQTRCELQATAGDKKAVLSIDFQVRIRDRIGMVIQYGPGSLVTRHRPVLAASRLLTNYQIPVVVVTNGQDADVLEGASGKIMGSGLESIPSKSELTTWVDEMDETAISEKRKEMESRILYAFEIDDRCPCDDTVCKIE